MAGSPGGLKLIKDLEKNFRVNFAASDDITGSRGGVAARCSCCPFACCRRRRRSDMVLETDSVDLNAIYFDPDEIRGWHGQLENCFEDCLEDIFEQILAFLFKLFLAFLAFCLLALALGGLGVWLLTEADDAEEGWQWAYWVGGAACFAPCAACLGVLACTVCRKEDSE